MLFVDLGVLQDTEGCIAKLADFLELPVDETLRRDIVRNVSFQQQKTTEEAASSASSLTNVLRIFRKGLNLNVNFLFKVQCHVGLHHWFDTGNCALKECAY
jgi:hypothetical protein